MYNETNVTNIPLSLRTREAPRRPGGLAAPGLIGLPPGAWCAV